MATEEQSEAQFVARLVARRGCVHRAHRRSTSAGSSRSSFACSGGVTKPRTWLKKSSCKSSRRSTSSGATRSSRPGFIGSPSTSVRTARSTFRAGTRATRGHRRDGRARPVLGCEGRSVGDVSRPDELVEGMQLEARREDRHRADRARFSRSLVLRDVEDLSYQEIAAVTGLARRHGEEPHPPRTRAAQGARRGGHGREDGEEPMSERRSPSERPTPR